MASLRPPFEHILFMLLKGNAARPANNPAGTALAVLAGFFALAGLGFLGAVGYGWLETQYGVRDASIYMGIGALGVAILCALSAALIASIIRAKAKTYSKMLMENIHAAVETVVDELETPIQENPKTAALIATVAGYMAAKHIL